MPARSVPAPTESSFRDRQSRIYRGFFAVTALLAPPAWVYFAVVAGVWDEQAPLILLLGGTEAAALAAGHWALARGRIEALPAEILMSGVLLLSALILVALGSSSADPGVRRLLQELGATLTLSLTVFLFLFQPPLRAMLLGGIGFVASLATWVVFSRLAGVSVDPLEWHRLLWVLGAPATILPFLPLYGELNASLQLETARRRRFEREASHDPLTGVANRRAADDAIAAAFAGDAPLSLVLFDLDHFKTINDRYGHERGDAVLSAVAAAAGVELRRGDLLARWGGEEFVVICPGTGMADALALAERLRRRVAHTAPTGLPPVTASFGVATRSGEDDARALLRRADAALYRAKAAGRDRVASEAHPPAHPPARPPAHPPRRTPHPDR